MGKKPSPWKQKKSGVEWFQIEEIQQMKEGWNINSNHKPKNSVNHFNYKRTMVQNSVPVSQKKGKNLEKKYVPKQGTKG
eukprot:CAMPEP_0170555620 /NCGR_PEP_ID=MMETSP0211-20121228/13505_1 /TAXON_ID=311385 /ORGANISM="Pseudokeronopsis sp., Strain OXSARD2" /LENGTH=78 /DNA_ID=CAMNT_0010865571 /DNA_START=1035 /DNA_END=1271 /DNA_ORIENTATION=-